MKKKKTTNEIREKKKKKSRKFLKVQPIPIPTHAHLLMEIKVQR
jgi:hypothetical protein